jgi:uncharacterized protein (TIGR00251 family)
LDCDNATVIDRRYSSYVATLRLHIVPNAKQNKVVGEHGTAIKIKLRAPAVEGKANAALRSLLAEVLNVPEREVFLERGEKSREKMIRVEGLTDEELRRRLLDEIP